MASDTPSRPSSIRKHQALLDAAERAFLALGFERAVVDDIADEAGVSKTTAYNHFGSKEALFVAVVRRLTVGVADAVDAALPAIAGSDDLGPQLESYAVALLDGVLDPRVMALRRLVIRESDRFPELAAVFWRTGPRRAMNHFRDAIEGLASAGALAVEDPTVAAETFNWLVLAAPVNAAMFLGDDALPDDAERGELAHRATAIFLAAHGAA